MSGILASDELKEAFRGFKSSSQHRWMQVSIEGDTRMVVGQRCTQSHSFEADYDKLHSAVEMAEPAYFLLRLERPSGVRRTYEGDFLLILYVPGNASVRQKMLYSSTEGSLKRAFGESIADVYHVDDKSELQFAQYGWKGGTDGVRKNAGELENFKSRAERLEEQYDKDEAAEATRRSRFSSTDAGRQQRHKMGGLAAMVAAAARGRGRKPPRTAGGMGTGGVGARRTGGRRGARTGGAYDGYGSRKSAGRGLASFVTSGGAGGGSPKRTSYGGGGSSSPKKTSSGGGGSGSSSPKRTSYGGGGSSSPSHHRPSGVGGGGAGASGRKSFGSSSPSASSPRSEPKPKPVQSFISGSSSGGGTAIRSFSSRRSSSQRGSTSVTYTITPELLKAMSWFRAKTSRLVEMKITDGTTNVVLVSAPEEAEANSFASLVSTTEPRLVLYRFSPEQIYFLKCVPKGTAADVGFAYGKAKDSVAKQFRSKLRLSIFRGLSVDNVEAVNDAWFMKRGGKKA